MFKMMIGLLLAMLLHTALSSKLTPTAALLQHLKAHRQWHAQFIQTSQNEDHMLNRTSYGHINIQQPKTLLWHTHSPHQQIIIVTPALTQIIDPELQQVRSTKTSKHQYQQCITQLLLNPTAALLQSWQITQLQADTFRIRPLQAKQAQAFKELTLVYNHAQYLKSVTVRNQINQMITLRFHQMTSKLSKGAFEIAIPTTWDHITE